MIALGTPASLELGLRLGWASRLRQRNRSRKKLPAPLPVNIRNYDQTEDTRLSKVYLVLRTVYGVKGSPDH